MSACRRFIPGPVARRRETRNEGFSRAARVHRRFKRATEMNPQFSQAFFYLGMSALHMKDRVAAEAALRRAVNLEPAAVNALYNLGVLLLDDKKPADAVKY